MRPASDTLSATFFALADPTRRAILVRLARGSASVKELSSPFEISGPAVSRHLRVLQRAGLIERSKEAQWRPRKLNATPLKDVAEWAGEFKRFWDASYVRLDHLLHTIKEEEKRDEPRR